VNILERHGHRILDLHAAKDEVDVLSDVLDLHFVAVIVQEIDINLTRHTVQVLSGFGIWLKKSKLFLYIFFCGISIRPIVCSYGCDGLPFFDDKSPSALAYAGIRDHALILG
jgi:hypothetical protein